MLKKRIIPCLDIKNGRTVKGVNFVNLRDAGDPLLLAQKYVEDGADELVFLDISATEEKRKTLLPLVEKIAQSINIPFTVGGGINSLSDAMDVIKAGADKISINSSAVRNPLLISELAATLGSQCVVVAIDAKRIDEEWMVFISGGNTPTGWKATTWAQKANELGAGEILLTSMDHDGRQSGFAIDLLDRICNAVNIPVIASGGAGTQEHFYSLFNDTKASAALAAGLFHFGLLSVKDLKNYLKTQRIDVR